MYTGAPNVRLTDVNILEYNGQSTQFESPYTNTPLTLDSCDVNLYAMSKTLFRIQVNPFLGASTNASVNCYYLIGIHKFGEDGYIYPDLG